MVRNFNDTIFQWYETKKVRKNGTKTLVRYNDSKNGTASVLNRHFIYQHVRLHVLSNQNQPKMITNTNPRQFHLSIYKESVILPFIKCTPGEIYVAPFQIIEIFIKYTLNKRARLPKTKTTLPRSFMDKETHTVLVDWLKKVGPWYHAFFSY